MDSKIMDEKKVNIQKSIQDEQSKEQLIGVQESVLNENSYSLQNHDRLNGDVPVEGNEVVSVRRISEEIEKNEANTQTEEERKQQEIAINRFTEDVKNSEKSPEFDSNVNVEKSSEQNIEAIKNLHEEDKEIPSNLAKKRTEFFIGGKAVALDAETSYSDELSAFKNKHKDFLANNKALKEHKRGKTKDTQKMTKVKDSLAKLSNYLETKPKAKDLKELESLRPELMALYAEAIDLCRVYESTRNPYTSAGKERRRMVLAARLSCEEELARLTNINFEGLPEGIMQREDFSWADILFYTSAIHIDETDKPQKMTSGAISDVYKVKQKNGDKEVVSFFSREHKFISYDVRNFLLRAAMKSAPRSKAALWCNDIIKLSDQGMRKVLENLDKHGSDNHIKTTINNICKERFNAEYGADETLNEQMVKYLGEKMMMTIMSLTTSRDMEGSIWHDIISKDSELASLLARCRSQKDEEIKKIHMEYRSEEETEDISKEYARVEGKLNLSRRNVASTVVAETFGFDFVSKSQHATMLLNGEYCTGNLMEQAQGDTYEEKIHKMSTTKHRPTVNYTPEAVKKMLGMQVFDIICGQTDRHSGNLKLDCEGKEEVFVKGIKLYDNDMAFGNLPFKDVILGTRFMCGLVRPENKKFEGRDIFYSKINDIGKDHPLNGLPDSNVDDSVYLSKEKGKDIFELNEKLKDYYANPKVMENLLKDSKQIFSHFDIQYYDKIVNANPVEMLFKMKGCQISYKEAACFLDRFYGVRAYLMQRAQEKDFLYNDEEWSKVEKIKDVVPEYNFSTLVLNLGEGSIGAKVVKKYDEKLDDGYSEILNIKKTGSWKNRFEEIEQQKMVEAYMKQINADYKMRNRKKYK